eukprot:1639228-Pleurochrysis_carterae.AAC.1
MVFSRTYVMREATGGYDCTAYMRCKERVDVERLMATRRLRTFVFVVVSTWGNGFLWPALSGVFLLRFPKHEAFNAFILA